MSASPDLAGVGARRRGRVPRRRFALAGGVVAAGPPLALLLARGHLGPGPLLWAAAGGAVAVLATRLTPARGSRGRPMPPGAGAALGWRAGLVAFACFVAAAPVLVARFGATVAATLRGQEARVGAGAALVLGTVVTGAVATLLCVVGGALAARLPLPGAAGDPPGDPGDGAARDAGVVSPAAVRAFAALSAAGLAGVATLPLALGDLAPGVALAGARRALVMVNPAILAVLAAAVGVRFAPRIGLRSRLAERAAGDGSAWRGFGRDARDGAAVGAVTALATVALAALAAHFGDDAVRSLDRDTAGGGALVRRLVAGALYGGVTEELMLRWGFLSAVAAGAWRLAGAARPGAEARRSAAMRGAVLVAAIAFGAAHLPAAAALVPLTPAVVSRTVVLNAVGGLAFGWLFWRRSLEAAMVAHATAHVVLFAIAIARLAARS